MASTIYDSSELIQTLKTRGLIPTANTAWAQTDFLKELSDEIDTLLLPELVKSRADHILTHTDFPITTGTIKYRIPYRAAANGLRALLYFDQNGNYYTLPEVEFQALPLFGASTQTTGTPRRYWTEGAYVILDPAPATGLLWTLRMWWHYKPSRICAVTEAMKIGSITQNVNELGMSLVPWSDGTVPAGIPADFTVNNEDGNARTYDLIRGKPPFDIIAMDLTATAAGGTAIEFAQSLATVAPDLAPGDYCCLSGTSPVPNIPEVFHPVVALLATAVCLNSQGDYDGANATKEDAMTKFKSTISLIQPRSRGNPRKVIQRNYL